MAEIHCRHFSGYKPCGLSGSCDRACNHFDEVMHQVVIVHLGALGAVLRSTGLLKAIKREFPKSMVTWVTQAPANKLLENNPLIDQVLTTEAQDLLQLQAFEPDVVFCIDKSTLAAGIARSLKAGEIRGFKSNPKTGAILPANAEAHELWNIGLSNHTKFFVNKKSENQLVHEALGLGTYTKDEYVYQFTEIEKEISRNRRDLWSPQKQILVGLNTGCSGAIPYKKLSVEYHRKMITQIQATYGDKVRIVLLGGPEDQKRNLEISKGADVIWSPTDRGLRDGMMSVAACDIVISGDSLGLHMAIAQKKWAVAWFGPTCAQEIELYGRGEKVLTTAPCSPCWKRVCDQKAMCYDLVELDQIMAGLSKGIDHITKWLNSSSKPHSPEISF